MFIVFLFWVVSPFKRSMIFLQPLFWNLKILIAETKKEPPIFPQRPSYFLEPWPTYPHCDSSLKLYITHQLTLSRTVLQSAGNHFFLPIQPQWHTNTHDKKKVRFYAFSPSVHKEKWLGQSLCIEPLVESCDGSKRGKERARKAVQMITSPHGFVERRPVNSFHHGRVRWGPREKGGAVEDTSCVAGCVRATPQRGKQPWI